MNVGIVFQMTMILHVLYGLVFFFDGSCLSQCQQALTVLREVRACIVLGRAIHWKPVNFHKMA
jgi:hypothetical protein